MVKRVIVALVVIAALGAWQWNDMWAWMHDRDIANLVGNYQHQVNELSDGTKEQMLADAHAYNQWLAGGGVHTLNATLDAVGAADPDTPEFREYASLLRTDGTSLIGYLSLPTIDTQSSVVHGTSPQTLSAHAGHLFGASLPVGGESTHAVIAAHSGWSRGTLFNRLEKVEVGERFYINVLGEQFWYEVESRTPVLPDAASPLLEIQPGRDLVSLITCFPTHINTHRLVVTGFRVEGPDLPVTGGYGGGMFYDAGIPWWAVIFGGGSLGIMSLVFWPKPIKAKSPIEVVDGAAPSLAKIRDVRHAH